MIRTQRKGKQQNENEKNDVLNDLKITNKMKKKNWLRFVTALGQIWAYKKMSQ